MKIPISLKALTKKKIFKHLSEFSLIAWTVLTFSAYAKHYPAKNSFSIVIFGAIFLLLTILFHLTKKNPKLFPVKNFRLSSKSLIIAFFAISGCIANFLMILFSDLNLSSLSLKIIFEAEINIIQKLISIFLFYFLFFILIYAIGHKILKIIKINFSSPLENFIFRLGLGFIPISFLVFLVALFGLLNPFFICTLLIFLALISKDEIISSFKKLNKFSHNVKLDNKKSIIKYSTLFFIFFLFCFLFVTNYKPIPITTDDLHTYYNTPTLLAKYEKYRPLYHVGSSNMGQNTEMIYAAIISVLSTHYIIHFQLISFFLCLAGFYVLSRYLYKNNSPEIAILSLILIPWNFYYIITVKVEFFLAFYLTLIVLLLLIWLEGQNNKFLYLIGVFSGVAIGIKYNAILLILPVYLLIFLNLFFTNKKFSFSLAKIKTFLVSSAIVILFFSPWAIKNIIYFNNIFYPLVFFSSEIPYPENTLANQEFKKNRDIEIMSIRHSIDERKLSILPAITTIWNQSTGKNIDTGHWVNFGFIPLLIIPFYLFYIRKNKQVAVVFFVAIIYVFLWFLKNAARSWYALFAIMLLYLLLNTLIFKYKKFACVYFFLAFFISAQSLLIFPANSYYLSGKIDEEEYRNRAIPYYKTAKFINKLNISQENKILLAGDFRTAFIEENDQIVIVDAYLSKTGYGLYLGDEYFLNSLKTLSIKYIIISHQMDLLQDRWLNIRNQSEKEYLSNYHKNYPSIFQTSKRLRQFTQKNAKLIFADSLYALYEIN